MPSTQEHAEQPAVGDRAAARDREPPGAVARAHHVGLPVPHEPRPQLGEPVARVAPREQVEHREEDLPRQLGEVRRPPHRGVQVVDAPLVDRAHRDELLGEHVERVARHARLLDRAREHALGDHARLEQVAPELREDLAAARLADLMARAADALQAARDRAGRLDLHDQVDRAHVDAELEAARRHDRAQLPRLQGVLDLEPLLARDRAVVGAHEVLVGELVELRREPLGEAPSVHEHDRRAVRADQLEQPRVDRRPDRGARRTRPRRVRSPGSSSGLPDRGHVLDRHDDLELHRLAVPGVDDRDRPRRAVVGVPAEEARDRLERPLGGRESDALRRLVGERLEPLEREREVRSALRAGERVDLVDDHRA